MSLAEIKGASETLSVDGWTPEASETLASTTPAGDSADIRRVASALFAIRPERTDTYAEWLQIGRALYTLGDNYYALWDAWSSQSAHYGEIREKWESFAGTNKITIKSLFWYAIQDGWKPPQEVKAADDSEFALMTAANLDTADTKITYIIEDVLVEGQPCLLGGASKTLKTSNAIDAAISLASKTPFLGRFAILKKCKVAIMSGESGLGVIQETARRIVSFRQA